MGGARVGAGKKVINIDIKRAKGTFRPHREKKKPVISEQLPCPPTSLTKRAKQIFQHLVKHRLSGMGIASASHTETIAMAAKEMAELEILDKIVETEGFVFKVSAGEDEKGDPLYLFKARPEVQMQKELRRHIHSLLCGEFGLSPGSSGRVKITDSGKKPETEFDGF